MAAAAEVEQLRIAHKEVNRMEDGLLRLSLHVLLLSMRSWLPGCPVKLIMLPTALPRHSRFALLTHGCPPSPQAEAAKTTVRLALEKVKALQEELGAKAQVGSSPWGT